MGFRTGNYARIWEVTDKGRYLEAKMSVSKRNKATGKYEQEWSAFGVRLVGHAANQAKEMTFPASVQLGSCDVTNKYDKEKKITYTNYVVFDFQVSPSVVPSAPTQPPVNNAAATQAADEELPF